MGVRKARPATDRRRRRCLEGRGRRPRPSPLLPPPPPPPPPLPSRVPPPSPAPPTAGNHSAGASGLEGRRSCAAAEAAAAEAAAAEAAAGSCAGVGSAGRHRAGPGIAGSAMGPGRGGVGGGPRRRCTPACHGADRVERPPADLRGVDAGCAGGMRSRRGSGRRHSALLSAKRARLLNARPFGVMRIDASRRRKCV